MFNATFPNPMLVALMLSAGPDTLNCRAKVSVTLPALASRVTACAVVTAETVARKVALAAPAATVTKAGTVTAVLLLERLTMNPPAGAAVFSVTVQASVPEPAIDALAQESAVNAAVPDAAVPVPLRAMASRPLAEELLVMVN